MNTFGFVFVWWSVYLMVGLAIHASTSGDTADVNIIGAVGVILFWPALVVLGIIHRLFLEVVKK